MGLILNIETSTPVCSASISENGKEISGRVSFDDKSHATMLSIYVNQIFNETGITAKQLSAVAVSQGPGSYTGLRIGVSLAKGICYAANVPLIAVNTLQAMALMAKEQSSKNYNLYCPMIDARRMEVYTALFDNNNCEYAATKALIIDNQSFVKELEKNTILFFGDGAKKCRDIITSSNSCFIDNIYPLASYMAILSATKLANKNFVDVAYFEPYYLKDFVATVAKNKVIG